MLHSMTITLIHVDQLESRNAQREARDEGNEDAISQLRKLGTVYLQNREISVMGAIYLICSMPLKNSLI